MSFYIAARLSILTFHIGIIFVTNYGREDEATVTKRVRSPYLQKLVPVFTQEVRIAVEGKTLK